MIIAVHAQSQVLPASAHAGNLGVPNGQMIIELDKKRMTATAQKDIAALKNRLCNGLIYTHYGTWRMVTWQSTRLPD